MEEGQKQSLFSLLCCMQNRPVSFYNTWLWHTLVPLSSLFFFVSCRIQWMSNVIADFFAMESMPLRSFYSHTYVFKYVCEKILKFVEKVAYFKLVINHPKWLCGSKGNHCISWGRHSYNHLLHSCSNIGPRCHQLRKNYSSSILLRMGWSGKI